MIKRSAKWFKMEVDDTNYKLVSIVALVLIVISFMSGLLFENILVLLRYLYFNN